MNAKYEKKQAVRALTCVADRLSQGYWDAKLPHKLDDVTGERRRGPADTDLMNWYARGYNFIQLFRDRLKVAR